MAVRILRARRGTAAQRYRYRDPAASRPSLGVLWRALRVTRGEHDSLRRGSGRPAQRRSGPDCGDPARRDTVAGVDVRIAEAEAALVTLDEAIGKSTRSLLERDGAILRLIYTFETVWKASQQLLAEREGITVASPNATIRAARRVGWLSDEDARAALDLGNDRNLAVRMYRGEIGAEIEARLAAHAALLRRWLEALQRHTAAE